MDLVQFLGRFHVLLLHLPLGILLMAGCLDVYGVYKKQPRSQLMQTIWLWGALSAAGAATLGYMLSLGGGYNADAIAVHRNWAIGVIACSFFCWFYFGRIENPSQEGKGKWVISLSILQMLLLFSTGHYGANMTHGETFLVEHAPVFVKKMVGINIKEPVTSVEQALVYSDVIEPILMKRCSGCHNESKAKGKLSLAHYESVLKDVVKANDLSGSELYQRITLPAHEEKFMPAEGKTPLTEKQISLIAWWIENGAENETPVATLKPTEAIHSLIAEELKLGSFSEQAIDVAELAPAAVEALEQAGFHISRIQQGQPFLSVIYASLKEELTDAKMAVLLKAQAQVKWLKLAKSTVNDEQLAQLSVFLHLTRLDVSNTQISNKGLESLAQLTQLKVNSFNTQVH